ncbi:hypothetical protein HPB47_005942 [Ixodes persulcatus]|uniref:Uncharacterized protein n=1 Tax=Ixodes persulcatus TaxID=34615 RepID=A0AC60PBU6_IXOPE|nr:hypothetical protein HPB47_005942 [Ixodes persulcatus]
MSLKILESQTAEEPGATYTDTTVNSTPRTRIVAVTYTTLYEENAERSTWLCKSPAFTSSSAQLRPFASAGALLAPGPDGVTYQALRNINECHYPNILEAFNHVWQTSEIPDAWKLSHVIPTPKSGKPLTSPESYRAISLTSCVGKLLERLVLRRLTWNLDAREALPEFTNEIGDPGPRFPIRPPHSTQPPLNVQVSLPDVRARKDLHPVVARTVVAVALEEKYASSLEIYADAKNAHALPLPTYHIRPFHEARLLIARNIRSRHPDPSTARGTPPIPVPDSRLTRADTSLLHRLRTGGAFTRLALHRYGRAGRVDSPECTVCGDPEDITHILLICPEYEQQGKRTNGYNHVLPYPTGSRRQAWSIFRALLEFLQKTELAESLDARFVGEHRLTKGVTRWLCGQLRGKLQRRREGPRVLTVEQQVLAALRFCAAGGFQGTVRSDENIRVHQCSVCRVLVDVTNAIIDCLGWKRLCFQQTQAEKALTKRKFFKRCKFSGVIDKYSK